jgi:hypothetical protein
LARPSLGRSIDNLSTSPLDMKFSAEMRKPSAQCPPQLARSGTGRGGAHVRMKAARSIRPLAVRFLRLCVPRSRGACIAAPQKPLIGAAGPRPYPPNPSFPACGEGRVGGHRRARTALQHWQCNGRILSCSQKPAC